MKKIISIVLAAALMLCTLFALASCGGLSGKYELDAFVASATYEFKGNKVTLTAEVGGFEKSFEGKYKLVKDGDAQKIEFTFDDKDAEKYTGSFSFEKGDGYIKIGGVKYKAVKD